MTFNPEIKKSHSIDLGWLFFYMAHYQPCLSFFIAGKARDGISNMRFSNMTSGDAEAKWIP